MNKPDEPVPDRGGLVDSIRDAGLTVTGGEVMTRGGRCGRSWPALGLRHRPRMRRRRHWSAARRQRWTGRTWPRTPPAQCSAPTNCRSDAAAARASAPRRRGRGRRTALCRPRRQPATFRPEPDRCLPVRGQSGADPEVGEHHLAAAVAGFLPVEHDLHRQALADLNHVWLIAAPHGHPYPLHSIGEFGAVGATKYQPRTAMATTATTTTTASTTLMTASSPATPGSDTGTRRG